MSEPTLETRKPDTASALAPAVGPWPHVFTLLRTKFLFQEGTSFHLVLVGETGPGLPAVSRVEVNMQRSRPALLRHSVLRLSTEWPMAKKKKKGDCEFPLFSPFMLPKGNPKQKKMPFEAVLYEKINRPLYSEKLQPQSRISGKLP